MVHVFLDEIVSDVICAQGSLSSIMNDGATYYNNCLVCLF
jgi:hypothetical protein